MGVGSSEPVTTAHLDIFLFCLGLPQSRNPFGQRDGFNEHSLHGTASLLDVHERPRLN